MKNNFLHTDLVSLKSFKANQLISNFDKDNISNVKVDVSLSLNADLSSTYKNDDDIDTVKLVFGAIITGNSRDEDNKELLSITYSIEYEFKVIHLDDFVALGNESMAKICSSIIYMDFRSKLSQALMAVGMSNMKLPLSISELQ